MYVSLFKTKDESRAWGIKPGRRFHMPRSALSSFSPLADPYDQAMIAKEEVKEEKPEPFQKIGPSMIDQVCNLSN